MLLTAYLVILAAVFVVVAGATGSAGVSFMMTVYAAILVPIAFVVIMFFFVPIFVVIFAPIFG